MELNRMRRKSKITLFIVLAAMFLQIAGGMALAVDVQGTEVRVSDDSGYYHVDQYGPSIWSDKVVWMKDNVEAGVTDPREIILKSGTNAQTYKGIGFDPWINGNNVVWDNDNEIILAIGDDAPLVVSQGVYGVHRDPAIYGNTVVCQVYKSGDWDIAIYDNIGGGGSPTILDVDGDQLLPVINGTKVVWQDNRNGNWDIYMYDTVTKVETPVATTPADQDFPAIYGNYIVWEENGDIYLYTISSGNVRNLTNNPYKQYDPAIYGDNVVWSDKRNGRWDIYLYNISSSREFRVTSSAGEHYFPAIYDKTVVWTGKPTATVNEHIYKLDFTLPSDNGGGGGGGSGSITLPPAGGPDDNPFIDVPDDYWAVNEIVYLAKNNIVKGFPDSTFRPQKPITRGELAVITANALNLDLDSAKVQNFTDVPEIHWAFKAIEATTKAGVMIGYGNGQFKPNNLIAREELVQVIIKALHYKNIQGEANRTALDIFKDKDKIPWWAKDGVSEAVNKGLVSGVRPDMFGAGIKATRDQVAVLMYKLLQNIR